MSVRRKDRDRIQRQMGDASMAGYASSYLIAAMLVFFAMSGDGAFAVQLGKFAARDGERIPTRCWGMGFQALLWGMAVVWMWHHRTVILGTCRRMKVVVGTLVAGSVVGAVVTEPGQ